MYVPNYENGNCAYLYNDNFIRVYETTPTYNSSVNYTDYLITLSQKLVETLSEQIGKVE